MAQPKFKGTMAQVNKALDDGGIIGKYTEVTITDNRYDTTDLLALIATDGGLLQPIILERTSAYSELSDTEDNLITVLSGVKKYTGPVDVDGDAAAAKLNTIAGLTTGKVTATLGASTAVSSATVKALSNVNSKDDIEFEPTDPLANDDAISALVSLNKILKSADFSGITDIAGTSTNIEDIKSAQALVDKDAVVAITGEISAKDANDISKNGGVLTATLQSGSVKSTLAALKDINLVKKADKLTFETTDKSVNARDLIALDAKLDTFTVTDVETITENAKDIGVAAKNITDALVIAIDANVTISGTLPATSAADIASIAAILATNGKVTATVAAGKAADLITAIAGAAATDALTLTLTDVTVAAADLNSLNALTAVAINANSVKTITGSVADVTTVYEKAAAKEISGLGNENVTITFAADAADINAVLKATSGIVSASVTAGRAADLFADLRDATSKDALFLSTLTGTDTAAELLALDNKTSIIVNASATTHTSGTAAELKKVFASSGIKVDGDLFITVTDTASAADVNTIAKATTNPVTATIKDGSVAATLKALADVTAADIITFKTTDKSVKASDLVDLNSKLAGGSFDKSKIETITGTAAETGAGKAIPLALAALGTTTNAEVKITGNVPVANIKAILDATTGKVTATLEAGDATAIKNALADTVVNNIAVTVNGATAIAADLVAILPLTSAKVKVDATAITGTFAEVSSVYTTNKSSFTALGNENVTISATNSASDINSIAKATTGKVTATVASGTAKDLLAALKDTNGKDALTITVGNTVADAKDLVALSAKTSLPLVTNNITDVNGTVAEVNKLIAAGIVTDPNYTLSGTVRAVDADDIAKTTSGVVTATIAAGTAENLNSALRDGDENAYTLTVNGTTASAATLDALNAKTSKAITVEAKEVVGTLAQLETVFDTNADDYKGLGNKNIKVSGTVDVTDIAKLDAILATTSGVVTATVGADTATDLIAGLKNATSGKDALTLVTDDAAATAAELLALDDATSVTVNAKAITANGISGNAADLKKLIASKGVEIAKNVDIDLSGTTTNASDLATILKATTGEVKATVAADTVAKLNSALKDANSADALTLSVNGTTVTAKDLLALGGKTSVATITVNVSAITGNITEITDVFVTGGKFIASIGADDVTISGTVKASEADAIADATTGTVTATIAAGTANVLNSTLGDIGQVNAYKITVSGDNANASDLLGLDTKTSVTVNAAAIKNIEAGTTGAVGTTGAEGVKKAYDANALKTISGLGNETVDLSKADDANAALVKVINDYTTGVIKLPTITFANEETTFSLSQLGDLKGITGLVAIDATNSQKDIINISIKDLLEANDSRDNIIFDITGETTDAVTLSDYSGWTVADATADQAQYVFTNSTTEQTITINLTTIADTTVL
ncbi:beta strand repeat-containing protein [Aliarcobacter butzleri]|uniref:beta strand repeat-containing protein n=1 Tax=Aliarcobacter butzleri TaxID=28197 RepID=UPI0021B54127|nr:hypothetical protein [Aliarcobacter butzleri]MCT7587524.1 hypothetical protein [Aliarcobacter butzleri]